MLKFNALQPVFKQCTRLIAVATSTFEKDKYFGLNPLHHQDLAFVFATVFALAYYSCDLFNEKQFGNLMTSFRGIIRFSWHNYKQGKQGSLSFNAWMNRVFWKVQTRKKKNHRGYFFSLEIQALTYLPFFTCVCSL